MFRFPCLLISILFCINLSPISAQNVVADNQIYGLNHILYNGKIYNYFPGTGVKGNQYFNQQEFVEGWISIRGIKYENLLLNYDILNQEVILKYTDTQGSNRLLVVSKAWLNEFGIGNENFSFIKAPDGKKLIVQTLNQGQIQLYSHWSKKIIANISFVSENYVFDNKRQVLFLSYKNYLKEYNSTKDILLLLLDNDAQEKVKSYMKKNKIRARTNSSTELLGLLNFCNQLDL